MRPYVKAQRVAVAGVQRPDSPPCGGAEQHSGAWQLRQQLPLTNCPEGANGAKAVMHGGLACGSVACEAEAGQNGGHDRAVCQGNATALKPVNQTFEDQSMTFG